MTRGEVWWCDFGMPFGSEPDFRRPVLIVQNDDFNESKIRTVVIVPFTTNLDLGEAPGNVFVDSGNSGLSKDSVVVVSQLTAIDKQRLLERVSRIAESQISDIENGILLVLGMKGFR